MVLKHMRRVGGKKECGRDERGCIRWDEGKREGDCTVDVKGQKE
jgi:hypothetical protein